MASTLSVQGVSKVYPGRRAGDRPVVAMNGVDLEVAESEFVTILGPSGCGKSTLLRLIAGLEAPTLGRIELDGQPVRRREARIIVVWQDFALLEWRTVLGNIEFGLELRGEPPAARRQKAEHFMEVVGLKAFARHYPSELSGGMKQRVGLARALVMDPQVLLMDEPFGALDAQTRLLMQEELLRIWQASRKTILFVTHSVDEAVLLGDRVVIFSAAPGRVKEDVPVGLARPRSDETRNRGEFVALCNVCTRRVRQEVLAAAE